jgi:diaminopimelate epimerase
MIRALKGHGTGNDFIIVPPTKRSLSKAEVALLCDRHFGIGADGLIRIVRTTDADSEFVREQDAEWFMDYRNADGSVAEMCGNGVRVFVHALIREGLAEPGELSVATRGGVRRVRIDEPGGEVSVDMGVGTPELPSRITIAEGVSFPASGMYFPNPHAVVFVDDLDDAGGLIDGPVWHPAGRYPQGVNVEFVRVAGPHHLQVRIHERGVGETLSCGTGVCAAVTVARDAEGESTPATWRVEIEGGTVFVDIDAEGETTLRGPAQIVATLEIDEQWLSSNAHATA